MAQKLDIEPLLLDCLELLKSVRDSKLAFEVLINITRIVEIYGLANIALCSQALNIPIESLFRMGDRFLQNVNTKITDE